MIEISHLVKKYGDKVAVNDLNLTVEPGKIYGFLGPNGAGKSTTMNIITGYIGATSGEVKINGIDINKNPEEAKKCIGYLPELPPLYLDMKVKEYLRFVAQLKNIKKEEQNGAIEKVMELTKTKDVENRLIKNLSKGYRQRVGFAQAIIGFPEVIILDEPTVGLDPKQIIEVRNLIKSLARKHTVILSSHILSEVSEVCDHVFIISKGKLVASDSMESLEAKMQGNQEIILHVKASEEAVDGMTGIKDVSSCSKLEEAADGSIILNLAAKSGEDIRESVFRYCVDNGMVILEMKVQMKSLEEVFLELTDSAAEEADKGAAEKMTEEGTEEEDLQENAEESEDSVTEEPTPEKNTEEEEVDE